MKKFVLAIFLIAIALASIVVEVRATNLSTVTLTVNPDQPNSTQYPYDAYSLVTLNETMIYNNYVNPQYPTDGLVGFQIQDSNNNPMVIRTLSTGGSIPDSIPATIEQAYLCNGNEAEITSTPIPTASNPFVPTIYFSVYNNQASAQQVLVTLNVFDSNGVPISVASQNMGSVPAYTSEESILGFNIPSSAHYGTANAYVDVYNAWPMQGGVPLGQEKAFTFTITGGSAFQGTPVTTASQNGSPVNNFNMTFRLPQYINCALGTYEAYSTASYLGVSGSTTTPFGVGELADINGDGQVNFNDITTFVALYINYFTDHVYSPQIDLLHTGSTINFNDITLFVGYYILAWSS